MERMSVCAEIIKNVIPVVVPVLIMVITLAVDKKRHKEQIVVMREKNRIDALPVLTVSHTTGMGYKNDGNELKGIEVCISLKNEGNGTAIRISIGHDSSFLFGAIAPGETSERIQISLHRDNTKEPFCIAVGFSDLYGNMYSENVLIDGSLSINKLLILEPKGITTPTLIKRTKD